MGEVNIITIILITLFAAALAYKSSFLKNRTIGRFTLHQTLYLVVIPGFVYTFIFSYIQSLLARPKSQILIASDSLLVNITLVAALFSYGGIAIHSISKMLSGALRDQEGPAKELNKYFHMNFSHNLTYSSCIAVVIGITLLELNHPSPDNFNNPIFAILKGLILGISTLVTMFWYRTPKVEDHLGRWSDLKTTFLVMWIGFFLLIYGIKKTDPSLSESDLLLSILVAFSIVALLNLFLIYKRLRHGGFRITLHLGKIKTILFKSKF